MIGVSTSEKDSDMENREIILERKIKAFKSLLKKGKTIINQKVVNHKDSISVMTMAHDITIAHISYNTYNETKITKRFLGIPTSWEGVETCDVRGFVCNTQQGETFHFIVTEVNLVNELRDFIHNEYEQYEYKLKLENDIFQDKRMSALIELIDG